MTLMDSLRITEMELAHQVSTSSLPHEHTDGPSRRALLGFFSELERIAQEHRHPHDGDEGPRPHPDRDDTAESLLLPSGDATACVLTPDGELIELVPILEPEMTA